MKPCLPAAATLPPRASRGREGLRQLPDPVLVPRAAAVSPLEAPGSSHFCLSCPQRWQRPDICRVTSAPPAAHAAAKARRHSRPHPCPSKDNSSLTRVSVLRVPQRRARRPRGTGPACSRSGSRPPSPAACGPRRPRGTRTDVPLPRLAAGLFLTGLRCLLTRLDTAAPRCAANTAHF